MEFFFLVSLSFCVRHYEIEIESIPIKRALFSYCRAWQTALLNSGQSQFNHYASIMDHKVQKTISLSLPKQSESPRLKYTWRQLFLRILSFASCTEPGKRKQRSGLIFLEDGTWFVDFCNKFILKIFSLIFLWIYCPLSKVWKT